MTFQLGGDVGTVILEFQWEKVAGVEFHVF